MLQVSVTLVFSLVHFVVPKDFKKIGLYLLHFANLVRYYCGDEIE
jgi:hypothetical protein